MAVIYDVLMAHSESGQFDDQTCRRVSGRVRPGKRDHLFAFD